MAWRSTLGFLLCAAGCAGAVGSPPDAGATPPDAGLGGDAGVVRLEGALVEDFRDLSTIADAGGAVLVPDGGVTWPVVWLPRPTLIAADADYQATARLGPGTLVAGSFHVGRGVTVTVPDGGVILADGDVRIDGTLAGEGALTLAGAYSLVVTGAVRAAGPLVVAFTGRAGGLDLADAGVSGDGVTLASRGYIHASGSAVGGAAGKLGGAWGTLQVAAGGEVSVSGSRLTGSSVSVRAEGPCVASRAAYAARLGVALECGGEVAFSGGEIDSGALSLSTLGDVAVSAGATLGGDAAFVSGSSLAVTGARLTGGTLDVAIAGPASVADGGVLLGRREATFDVGGAFAISPDSVAGSERGAVSLSAGALSDALPDGGVASAGPSANLLAGGGYTTVAPLALALSMSFDGAALVVSKPLDTGAASPEFISATLDVLDPGAGPPPTVTFTSYEPATGVDSAEVTDVRELSGRRYFRYRLTLPHGLFDAPVVGRLTVRWR